MGHYRLWATICGTFQNIPNPFDARERHDPCKLELRKHSSPLETGGTGKGTRPEYAKPSSGGPEPRMAVRLWDQLDATPYGRLGRLAPPAADAKPYELANRITVDQFNAPGGYDVLVRELPRGKRVFAERSSIALA